VILLEVTGITPWTKNPAKEWLFHPESPSPGRGIKLKNVSFARNYQLRDKESTRGMNSASTGNYQVIDEESSRGRGCRQELLAYLCWFWPSRSNARKILQSVTIIKICTWYIVADAWHEHLGTIPAPQNFFYEYFYETPYTGNKGGSWVIGDIYFFKKLLWTVH
jgi:hypothetical protein